MEDKNVYENKSASQSQGTNMDPRRGGKLTVRTKIALSFGVMIALMMVMALISINRLGLINDRLNHIVDVTAKRRLFAIQSNLALLRQHRAEKNIILASEAADIDKFVARFKFFENDWHTKLKDLSALSNASEKQMIDQIEEHYSTWRAISSEVQQFAIAGNDEPARLLSQGKGQQIFEDIEAEITNIIDDANQKLAKESQDSNENYVKVRNAFGIFGFLFVIGAGGVYALLNRDFMKVVANIQGASMKILSSSNEILAATKEQQSTTTEQSNQMNEIQSTLREASSASAEISSTSQEVASFAKQTKDEAQAGSKLIKTTNEKMAAIKDSNKNISDRLVILNEKIEGITKMLSTILAVADQTNLLSLNAAIEAAKAGEQGKGFSVVAQEIRRLADQTAQSSKEISDLINEIQVASTSAIMTMEKSTQDTQSGTTLVSDFAGRFSGITDMVQNMLPQIENISKTITEQATGNKEIVATITQMGEAMKMTAASAGQLNQTVYDLTAIGQELKVAVREI